MHSVILSACAASLLLAGCVSDPLAPPRAHQLTRSLDAPTADVPVASRFREGAQGKAKDRLGDGASPDMYIRAALFNSPELEAAYQRWVARAERVPQVGTFPDPRLSVGFFANEVETRVGPQQARFGISQTIPWLERLNALESAAAAEARAAWFGYKASELKITRRVIAALHELSYLNDAIAITEENLGLLESFEQVARARYRVATGSHPDLIRTQVELGQLDDRLAQLRAMRPTYVARLNAAMGRASDAAVGPIEALPEVLVDAEVESLVAMGRESSPALLAIEQQAQGQRQMTQAARYAARPELTLGLDYIVTDEAIDPSIAESGDDPVLLSFGINLPIWREKYDSMVAESIAQRLALGHEREGQANALASSIHEAYFQHTDAHRRVRLYERILIPKARESLQSSLAGFRAGDTSFTDLLDTERTLLEFALAAQRARADRGIALAQLQELVGAEVPVSALEDEETEAGQ